VSITTKPGFAQPALLGGLVMGVLSALPLVNLGNACCCLWVVSGGVVAAYLFQQNLDGPITLEQGALVGLLAGLAGAGIHFVLSIPIGIVMTPVEQAMMQRVLQMSGPMPPDVRDMFERMSGQQQGALGFMFQMVGHVVTLIFMLFVGAIFSTLGGVLGTALFKKPGPTGDIPGPAQ
jgi:hypothetical protein